MKLRDLSWLIKSRAVRTRGESLMLQKVFKLMIDLGHAQTQFVMGSMKVD